MRFFHTQCKMCGAYIFDPDNLIAYQCGNAGLFQVDLQGEQPWTGIHCVCKTCVTRLAEMVVQKDE